MWTTHYEDKLTRQTLDIKCDSKAERMRAAARKHLTNSLVGDDQLQVIK